MEREWKSRCYRQASARLISNGIDTAFGMEARPTYLTPPELREFGQWLIAQADELAPAPKTAPTFKVGDRVRIVGPWASIKDRHNIVPGMEREIGVIGNITHVSGPKALYSGWCRLGGSSYIWPPDALELVSDKPEKRFHFRAANRDYLTRDEARKQMEDFTKSDGVARVLLEAVATCKRVDGVEWS